MVTTRDDTDPGLTAADQAEAFARNMIAGHPEGSVRRISLYLIVFLLLGIGIYVPMLNVLTGVIVALLALTDQLA